MVRGEGEAVRKSLDEIRDVIRRNQDNLIERYGLRVSGVFGSYVRGDQEPDSDLDLLAEFVRPVSLLELVGAELYLTDVIGVKVDLVPQRSVRVGRHQHILNEAITV